MRAILTALIAVALVATAAATLLDRNVENASDAFVTKSVRLGEDGGKNLIGGRS